MEQLYQPSSILTHVSNLTLSLCETTAAAGWNRIGHCGGGGGGGGWRLEVGEKKGQCGCHFFNNGLDLNRHMCRNKIRWIRCRNILSLSPTKLLTHRWTPRSQWNISLQQP